jgi:prevent-host-death family protein
MTTYTLTEARKHFPDLIEKSHELFEQFIISRKGVPAAVIVDYDLFESMKETLNIVLDRKLAQRLRETRKDIKKSKEGKNWSALRQELTA